MLKATENNAVYTSQILKQEEGDGDWASYDLTVTTDPKDLGVLDTSTQTQLETTGELVNGDELIIHDGVSFKEGTIGAVTYDAGLVPPQSINNTTYDDISKSLKESTDYTTTQPILSTTILSIEHPGSIIQLRENNNQITIFVLNTTHDTITEYDINGNVLQSGNVPHFVGGGSGFLIIPDGTKIIVGDSGSMKEVLLGVPWDLSTMTAGGTSPSLGNFFITAINIYGGYLYVTSTTDDTIRRISISNNFDVTTATVIDTSYFYGTNPAPGGFSYGAWKTFIVDAYNKSIKVFSGVLPGNINYIETLTHNAFPSFGLADIKFSSDGRKCFVLYTGVGSFIIEVLELDYPYNLKEATFSVSNPASDFKTIKLV